MNITDLKEKWQELFIRFNTSPKLYQKIDFLQLLKFLKGLLERGTGLVEDDLKTINGESIVGEGDIKTPDCELSVDYSFQLEGKYIYIEGDYDETEESITPKNATFVEQENTIIL